MRHSSGTKRFMYAILVLSLLLSVVAVACQGPAGRTGPAGPAGPPGQAGPPGSAGKAGEAVKSAASLEVTPGAVITGRFVTSIRGSGFKADEAVLLVLEKAVKGEDFVFAGATANAQGAFTVAGAGGQSARGMAVAAIPLGTYTLRAIGTAGTVATTPLEIVAVPRPTPIPAPAAQLRVDPPAVVSGRWVTSISGSGFKADETVLVVLEKAVKGEDFIFAGAIANKQGAFYITGAGGQSARGMAVAAIPPGTYVVKATGTAGTVVATPLQITPAPTPTPVPTPKVKVEPTATPKPVAPAGTVTPRPATTPAPAAR